jgi:hypothetical protein
MSIQSIAVAEHFSGPLFVPDVQHSVWMVYGHGLKQWLGEYVGYPYLKLGWIL